MWHDELAQRHPKPTPDSREFLSKISIPCCSPSKGPLSTATFPAADRASNHLGPISHMKSHPCFWDVIDSKPRPEDGCWMFLEGWHVMYTPSEALLVWRNSDFQAQKWLILHMINIQTFTHYQVNINYISTYINYFSKDVSILHYQLRSINQLTSPSYPC